MDDKTQIEQLYQDLYEAMVNKDEKVVGKSRVTAAVFGGGKRTWRLELTFDLKKRPDGWKFVRAEASTW